MVGGREEHEILGEEGHDQDVRVVHRPVEDGEVETTVHELGEHGDRGALGDDDPDPRVALADLGEQLGHEPTGRGADDADAYVARYLLAERGEVGDDGFELGGDAARPGGDQGALGGETTGRPIDEGDAQLALELGDVGRDVRLHGVQGLGGAGERPVVGDRHEGGELAKVHRQKR